LRCCLVAASTLGFIVFSSRVAGLVFLLIVGGVVCAPEAHVMCADHDAVFNFCCMV
jgi:hypothetical protein